MSLSVGSLFSGIGGFDLGLERAGMSVKWQVEIDPYCQRVLTKHWPGVQRYGDIKAIDWASVEPVDLVCGGFPCQPFSVAGKQRGKDDDRYLWPEVVRCLSITRPTWFFGENVPGIINVALYQVCADLESIGYEVAPPLVIPACAVNAPHTRNRVWILAYSSGDGLEGRVSGNRVRKECCEVEAEVLSGPQRAWDCVPTSRICRVADGLPNRAHRTRGLGNAIVPQIAETIGRMIHTVHVKEHANDPCQNQIRFL